MSNTRAKRKAQNSSFASIAIRFPLLEVVRVDFRKELLVQDTDTLMMELNKVVAWRREIGSPLENVTVLMAEVKLDWCNSIAAHLPARQPIWII